MPQGPRELNCCNLSFIPATKLVNLPKYLGKTHLTLYFRYLQHLTRAFTVDHGSRYLAD